MSEMLRLQMQKMTAVNDEEFDYIYSYFKRKEIPKKEHVLKVGQICNALNFCEKGCFRSYYITEQGEEIVVDFLLEDYWVGDLYSLINPTTDG